MHIEIFNKLSQDSILSRSEDMLTSNIFGHLRYFKKTDILKQFIESSVSVNNEKPKLEPLINTKVVFWKKLKWNNKYHEPDILIESDNQIIIVECKYFSTIEESVDRNSEYSNQLIRYFNAVKNNYPPSYKITVVYLTNEQSQPKELLKNTERKINHLVFWLCWPRLYVVLQKEKILNTTLNDNELLLLEDLLYYLNVKKMKVFNGINTPDEKMSWNYLTKNIYGFNSIKNKSLIWRYHCQT